MLPFPRAVWLRVTNSGGGPRRTKSRRRLEILRCTRKALLHSCLPSPYLCETWPRFKKGHSGGAGGSSSTSCRTDRSLSSTLSGQRQTKRSVLCQGSVTRLVSQPHEGAHVLLLCSRLIMQKEFLRSVSVIQSSCAVMNEIRTTLLKVHADATHPEKCKKLPHIQLWQRFQGKGADEEQEKLWSSNVSCQLLSWHKSPSPRWRETVRDVFLSL